MELHINEEKEMVKLIKNPLNEMAKIGTFGNKVGESGNYEVWVYNKEGDGIPHFHIVNSMENFSCCVKILKPDYFIHTGKEDTLNSKLKKSLINFLTSKHRKRKNITNWEYICMCWDDNNSNYELSEEIYDNMPDYTKLP